MTPEELARGEIPGGAVIESRFDLAARWPEKFERLFEDSLPNTSQVWDSTKETLEQFTSRMRATQGTGGAATVQSNLIQPPPQSQPPSNSPAEAGIPSGYTPPGAYAGPPPSPPSQPSNPNAAQPSQHLTLNTSSNERIAEYKELYDSMTVPELRKVAAEEEVDLRGASRKEDIVQLLLNATK
jgi:hypothetical protein